MSGGPIANQVPQTRSRPRATRRGRRGFTLFEVVVLVIVIGIVALVVVPATGSGGSVRVAAAANVLASDLEYCQSACITNPGAPLAVEFSAARNKYVLAPGNAPGSPVRLPGDSSQLYVNDFASGRWASLDGVQLVSVNGQTTGRITFDAYGRPLGCDSTGTTFSVGTVTVILRDGGSTLKVVVDSATGEVSIP